MSIAQQAAQVIVFTKAPSPLSKEVPTVKQFDQFKNPNVYGVWIDGKKVTSKALNNYKNTDFSQVYVSKLHGTAKKRPELQLPGKPDDACILCRPCEGSISRINKICYDGFVENTKGSKHACN